MEPQLPSPSHSPENGPAHLRGGETFLGGNQPEKAPEEQEKQETREQHAGGPSGDPAGVIPAVPVLPQLPTIAPPKTQQKPVDDGSNPLSADDVDLIEKEWVEKAKKVVAATKHDPYLQGKEVSKLQADYLKKRYDKTIKLPSDGA